MSKSVYAHAIGRIKVRETKLFDSNTVNRLIDEPHIESFYRILEETDYGEFLGKISEKTKNTSTIANLAYKNLKSFIMEIAPEPEKINIFYYKYDFHNIKLLFKSHYLNQTSQVNLIDLGNIEPNLLTSYFSIDNKDSFNNNEFADIIVNIFNKFNDNFDPLSLDIYIDKLYFEFIAKKINKYKEIFLKDWLKTQIDFTNIKTFMRIENLHESEEILHLQNYLIPGGDIEHDIFLSSLDDYQLLINKLSISPYFKLVQEGINYCLQNKSFSLLEKLMDNYIIEMAKQTRYILFGLEPLAGYLIAKEQEIKILRIILTCKLNGLPIDTIKERVGETYA